MRFWYTMGMKSKNSKINAIKRARAAYRREMVKYYFNEGLTQRQMATELEYSGTKGDIP